MVVQKCNFLFKLVMMNLWWWVARPFIPGTHATLYFWTINQPKQCALSFNIYIYICLFVFLVLFHARLWCPLSTPHPSHTLSLSLSQHLSKFLKTIMHGDYSSPSSTSSCASTSCAPFSPPYLLLFQFFFFSLLP